MGSNHLSRSGCAKRYCSNTECGKSLGMVPDLRTSGCVKVYADLLRKTKRLLTLPAEFSTDQPIAEYVGENYCAIPSSLKKHGKTKTRTKGLDNVYLHMYHKCVSKGCIKKCSGDSNENEQYNKEKHNFPHGPYISV